MPLLRLLRIAGVFTAMSDVLAGYLIIRFYSGGEGSLRALLFLLGASACLYMAGMAWNDIFDYDDDIIFRPERPLPSRQLTMTTAFVIAVLLSFCGIMLAMAAGMDSFLVAGALILSILLYDGGGKKLELAGPVLMGICRGANLLLGMSAHPYLPIRLEDPVLILPPVLLAVYTMIITAISAYESGLFARKQESVPEDFPSEADTQLEDIELEFSNRPTAASKVSAVPVLPVSFMEIASRAAVIISGVALIAVPLCGLWMMPQHPVAGVLFGILLLMLAAGLYRLYRIPDGRSVRKLVGLAIIGMVVMDAAMVASFSSWQSRGLALPLLGWPLASPTDAEIAGVLLILALIIPANLLRRRISLT